MFNPIFYNSAWAYLTSGNPPIILQFAIANGLFVLLFMFYRARKSKADYPRTRGQLQLLMGLTNTVILLGDSIYPAVHDAMLPFKGLLDFL